MKNSEGNYQQSLSDRHKEMASNSEKVAYSSPALTIYGSVNRLTMGSGGKSADMNNTTKNSDRSIKENIVRVGEHPFGVGLYLFYYKPEYREESGHGRQFGVMADEVEAVMPEAVVVHPDGHKMVNYSMLGIDHTIH